MKNVMAALPVALLLPFVGALALGLRALAGSPRFSTAAAFTVLATLFLIVFVALVRRTVARAGILAACHVLTWVPFVALGVWQVIAEGIVASPHPDFVTGGRWLHGLGSPAGGLVFLVAGTVFGFIVMQRGTDRSMRIGRTVAIGVGVFVFAAGAGRLGRPDPDTYLASLRTAAELRRETTAVVGGRSFRYSRVTIVDPFPVADLDASSHRRREECVLTGLEVAETYYPRDGECPTLRVRLDPRGDLGVIDGVGAQPAPPLAFRPRDGVLVGISSITESDRLAPPIGWTIGAGAGLLLALGCTLASRRLRRRAEGIEGREAQHRGEGWVELEDGASLRVAAAAPLPEGPVVLGDEQHAVPTYRIAGAASFGAAWAGTLEELRTARLDLATSLDVIAVAAVTLGATPLFVARLLGAL